MFGHHSHRRIKKQIRQLFTDGLDGESTAKLWRSLYQCPSCAKFYEQHATLESALTGASQNRSVFSIERTGNAVLNRLPSKSKPTKLRWVKRTAPIVAALGVAIVAIHFFTNDPSTHRVKLPNVNSVSMNELSPRGSTRSAISSVGFRVFAVTPGTQMVHSKPQLHIDDIITFTYTYTRAAHGHLMLFGLQKNSTEPLWYYPDYGEKQSISIEGNRVDEPLGDGVQLSVNHKTGLLRIVSLFSKKPIAVEQVEEAIKVLKKSNGVLNPDAPLPIDKTDLIEYSIILEVQDLLESGGNSRR